jgi:tetratricopeptide (TPR) repeat protein
LGRYALATVDETSLTLHRLVALVTREKLSKNPAEYNRYAEYAALTIGKPYPFDSDDYREWERCEELLRHAETVAEYADAANIVLDAAGRLYNQTGLYLRGRAQYSAARQNLERAVAIGERNLGKEHPDVATYYNNLGVLLKDMGELPAAKTYYEQAIAIGEKTLGKEHPDVATRYNNLGGLLQDMGELPAAKSYLERAIAIDERIYGKEHPDVARDYNNYGVLLYQMGERAGARDYLRRALAIWRAKLGEQHPNTKIAARWLAQVENSMGE